MTERFPLPARSKARAQVARRALPLISEASGNLSSVIFAMIDPDDRQFEASAELIEKSIASLETAAKELRAHLEASAS